jgi:hypothetical protein
MQSARITDLISVALDPSRCAKKPDVTMMMEIVDRINLNWAE